MIEYVPCNGINSANLLHCPTVKAYRDQSLAVRVAKRHKLTHVAHMTNGRVFKLEAVI